MISPKRRVLVTVPFFDDESKTLLESNNCQVSVVGNPDGDLPASRLIGLLHEVQAWLVGHAHVTREVLEASPSLMVIARRGVGYERVDTVTAAALGRVVTIAAGGNAPSVADHTVGLMIAAGRRFHESRVQLMSGDWSIPVGTELNRKTVGLLGFGRISRLVARRLAGFETRILACAPRPEAEAAQAAALGVTLVDFPTLLRESDYLSLHIPLVNETRNLIDQAALHAMKPTSILINTSRGGLVDEAALLEALRNQRIRGAAFDVFHCEQDPSRKIVAEQLLALKNFTATPHAAGSTDEALARSNLLAAQSIIAVLNGGNPVAECLVVDGRSRISV